MEIKNLKDNELGIVNDMYEEFTQHTSYSGDSLDFVINYLERCECCDNIVYGDSMIEKTMWNGKKCLCCQECQKISDDESSEYEIDEYDEYEDRKLESEEI